MSAIKYQRLIPRIHWSETFQTNRKTKEKKAAFRKHEATELVRFTERRDRSEALLCVVR